MIHSISNKPKKCKDFRLANILQVQYIYCKNVQSMTKFLKMVTAQPCDTVTAQPSQLESADMAELLQKIGCNI